MFLPSKTPQKQDKLKKEKLFPVDNFMSIQGLSTVICYSCVDVIYIYLLFYYIIYSLHVPVWSLFFLQP